TMKQHIVHFTQILLLGFIAISMIACFHKEDFDMSMLAKEQNLPYDLALPLVDVNLTVANLTGGLDMFVPDKEGLVHIIYGPPIPTFYSVAD
ncbi:MAG: hypothetical protein RR256_04405, partial [Bacteroidales bacterium]